MKHDFEVLAEMSKNNQDVRAGYTVTDVKMVKAGGLVTMGVDHKTAQELILGGKRLGVAIVVFDFSQFEAIKNAEGATAAPLPTPAPETPGEPYPEQGK